MTGSSLCNGRLGTSFQTKRWLSLDPCGLICVSFSYSLHIFALVTINHTLISDQIFSQVVYYVLYAPVATLALCNLYMAQHSDPGVVPLGARPLPVVCSPVSSPSAATGGNGDEDTSSSAVLARMRTSSQNDIGNGSGSPSVVAKDDGDDDGDDDDDENGFNDNDSKSLLASASRVDHGEQSGLNQGRDGLAAAAAVFLGKNNTSSSPSKRRRGIRRCRKCNDNYKPPRAHHDSVTGRCIVKFDHFCPWVGNAVGALNHKFFFLFVFYTFISSILSLLLLLIRFIRCGFMVSIDDGQGTNNINNSTDYNDGKVRYLLSTRWLEDYINDDDQHSDNTTFKYQGCEPLYSISTLILILISVAFLFFTCCMLVEQMDAIETNTSKIARMKMKMGHADANEYARVGQDFNEFFGGDSIYMALHWFLPLPIWFPDGKKDKVMGFEYKDSWYGKIYHEGIDDDDDDDEYYDEERGNAQIMKKDSDDHEIEFNENNNEGNTNISLTKSEVELPRNYGDDTMRSAVKKRATSKNSTETDANLSLKVV